MFPPLPSLENDSPVDTVTVKELFPLQGRHLNPRHRDAETTQMNFQQIQVAVRSFTNLCKPPIVIFASSTYRPTNRPTNQTTNHLVEL